MCKDNDNKPNVSICLLTYNRSQVIRRSIESLLNQTYTNFELLINDDNSTDDTESVCRDFVFSDPRVRYFRNGSNLMYSGNSNAAVMRSRGKYILFAHDGDLYERDLLVCWVGLLDRYSTAAIAFSGWEMMDNNGEISSRVTHGLPELIDGKSLLREMLHSLRSPIFGIAMVRASSLRAVGEFNDRFPRLTDVDMWMRLLARYDATYTDRALFRVMPRETGHDNVGVNWRIEAQLEDIRYSNIIRFLSTEKNALYVALVRLYYDRYRVSLHNLLWCVRYRRLQLVPQGIRHILRKPINVDNAVAKPPSPGFGGQDIAAR